MSPERPDQGSEEQEQTRRAEKERQWQAVQKRVETITDGLGLGVDDGIKETVIGFLANDLETDGSCEGHPDQKHGESFPWVDVCAPEPKGWEDSETLQGEWKEKNLIMQRRFLQGLGEFYQGRDVPVETRLIAVPMGIYGAFRVHSQGAESMSILPAQEQQAKAEEYKAEMAALAVFLKEKFLSSD